MNCMLDHRKVDSNDVRMVFDWSMDEATRENSLNTSGFAYEEHQKWFERKLKDPEYHILIYMDGEVPVGMLRIERTSEGGLISIAVSPDHRGKGYGEKILACASQFANDLKYQKLVAQIWSENKASIQIFERNAYEFESEFELEDGRTFKQYIRKL